MTLTRRALRAVTTLTVIVLILRAFDLWLLLNAHSLSLEARMGTPASPDEVRNILAFGGRVLTVAYVTIIAYLCSFIAFTYAAYSDLRAAQVPRLRFRPLTAALLYLVPVWNVVHPLVTLQELFRASQYESEKAHLFDWRDEERSSRISVAWLLAVAGFVFDVIAVFFMKRMPAPDVMVLAVRMWIATSITGAVALLLYRSSMATITQRIDAL